MMKAFKISLIAIVSILYVAGMSYLFLSDPKYKYTIRQNNTTWNTNAYTVDTTGCINFANSNNSVRVCGPYSITNYGK